MILYSGSRLSRYGDIIAEKIGLARAWIGLVLMASVTSLPELVTGISSVTYAGVPDIAIGDVLGSCGLTQVQGYINEICLDKLSEYWRSILPTLCFCTG